MTLARRKASARGLSQVVHRALVIATIACISAAAIAADPGKVLRIASPDIDSLDPQGYTDDPSFQVQAAIFEPAYEWDYLADPPRLAPLTAAGPPAVSADGRTWTVRIRPGIHFTDDPAFGGQRRELTAADYVYSYKRWMDPNGKRGGWSQTDRIVGARPVVDAAAKTGKFDFDRPMEGLRTLDRYTFQIQLTEPNYPNIKDVLAFIGAAAREVVEAAGNDIRVRAVGTGPYRLREWRRGSRIVLEANSDYRWVAFPGSADRTNARLVESMRGRTLPQIGVVEISIIEEDVTRLLQFEQGGLDIVTLRGEVANRLLQDGKLKPDHARRGVSYHAFAEPFLFSLYFYLPDPVIGGMDTPHVALRRAIALAIDVDALVSVVYAGLALPASQMVPPGVGGHDRALPARSAYDPRAANALLDRFGFKRGADGYRSDPEGKPLTLTLSLRTGNISREQQTLMKRSLDAVGLRLDFRMAPFQDIIKELEQGRYQMYYGGFGGSPSGINELQQLYSQQSVRLNISRFSLPEYDRHIERFVSTDSDAEQVKAARAMNDLVRAYAPIVPLAFRLQNEFVQPWVRGYAPPRFTSYWKYLDVDPRAPGRRS